MSTPFSSPFHHNELLRTKNYLAGSLFETSFNFKLSKGANVLTEIPEGPLKPDGPAAPDGMAVAVGMVAEANNRTDTLGNWTRYSEQTYNKTICDAKFNFLIMSPDNDPTFASAFPTAIAALKKLQNSVAKTKNHLYLVVKENGHDAIRFSFKVFERKTSSSAPTIDIDSYPVPTECRESLEKIAGNYVVRDFVVWDVDGKCIPPQDISSKLPGALVECYFGITHHSFGGDDTFGGIIQQVIILRAAAPKPPSPIKPSALRPYRATILSPEQVHAQEQRAVSFFTTPVSSAGPSNTTVPITKRKASAEPEGSNPKRVNTSENMDGSNDKGKERKKADEDGN
ncbi:hypothetical protein DFH08DRAFT_939197 [Mycena albidolilacea]|uniref:Uncharacterized protein n=1 Tax=Mycena albidolilacea TaxID=1033008 RepID=A0AAD6ZSF1_9AGAR|nr:hypothetical protein DFH08DRAFT_939197 [Mycena albidolilacea]